MPKPNQKKKTRARIMIENAFPKVREKEHFSEGFLKLPLPKRARQMRLLVQRAEQAWVNTGAMADNLGELYHKPKLNPKEESRLVKEVEEMMKETNRLFAMSRSTFSEEVNLRIFNKRGIERSLLEQDIHRSFIARQSVILSTLISMEKIGKITGEWRKVWHA